MKSRPFILTVSAAGFLIGFLAIGVSGMRMRDASAAGRQDREKAWAGLERSDAPLSTWRGERGERGDRTPDKSRTFAKLLKEAPVLFERNKPYKDLERMDAGQLKTVILECLQQAGPAPTMQDRQAASGVMGAAVRELYKREGDKALEWAAAETPEAQRSVVLSELLIVVARESPDTMKQWADRYRGQYGDQWAERFDQAAVVGAIERGAAELLRVRELLGTRAMPFGSPDFPDDFDFHLLITKSKPDFGFQDTVAQWAARDKEAAWNGVKEVMSGNGGNGASYFGAMFRGVLAMEGDEKAAAWLVGKVGDIPEAGRERALQSLAMFPLGSDAISALVRAFPDPADKVSYASQQFSSFRPGSGLSALRALDSPQLQTEALMAVAARHAAYPQGGPQGEKTRQLFSSTIDQLQLDPQSREKIMEALAQPPSTQQ